MKNFFDIFFVILLFLANTNVFAQESKSNSSPDKQIASQVSADDKLYSKEEVDTQAVFKKFKVHPKLLKECISGGIVKIKMVLHKSGQVTDVAFTEKNGCENIEEEKIIASIRKLKFSTAMKNGVPVSQIVVKTLKFSSL